MAETQIGLLSWFNKLLQPEIFDDYGPNGLQIEGKSEIKRVAFAVSATQDSIKKAIAWKADALVVHHGIFWRHQGSRPVTGAWGDRLKLAVKNDLNLFAFHLPLDAHPEVGNAVALAHKIDLTELQPFGLYKRQPLGAKGVFASPLKASELEKKLEKVLGHKVILASSDSNKDVRTLGIITGGANNEWTHALQDNLDAYLTGEISEYNWHDAIEAGIHFFAGGHHATEKFGIQSLMSKLKQEFPNLEVTYFDSENPA